MNREHAKQIHSLVNEMFERANDVLAIVNNFDDVETRKKVQMILGTVIAELDLEILEPIYRQFPKLRPPEMTEIKDLEP